MSRRRPPPGHRPAELDRVAFDLLDVADGAAVFLCEDYAPPSVRWHLDLDVLARNRDRLACQRMILIHLSPTGLAADRRGWETAYDGMQLR